MRAGGEARLGSAPPPWGGKGQRGRNAAVPPAGPHRRGFLFHRDALESRSLPRRAKCSDSIALLSKESQKGKKKNQEGGEIHLSY